MRGTKGTFHKYGVDIQEDQLRMITDPTYIRNSGFGKEPRDLHGTIENLQENGQIVSNRQVSSFISVLSRISWLISAAGYPTRTVLISSCTRILLRASERKQSWLSSGKKPPPSFSLLSWPTRAQMRARDFRSTLCSFEKEIFILECTISSHLATHTWPNLSFKSDIIPIRARRLNSPHPHPACPFHLLHSLILTDSFA